MLSKLFLTYPAPGRFPRHFTPTPQCIPSNRRRSFAGHGRWLAMRDNLSTPAIFSLPNSVVSHCYWRVMGKAACAGSTTFVAIEQDRRRKAVDRERSFVVDITDGPTHSTAH